MEMIILSIIEFFIAIFATIKPVNGFLKTRSASIKKKLYGEGIRLLSENKNEIASSLSEFYTPTIDNGNDKLIQYRFANGKTINLPLISQEKLIRTNNHPIHFAYYYTGKSGFKIDKKIEDEAKKKWQDYDLHLIEGDLFSLDFFQQESATINIYFQSTTFFRYRATYGNIFDEIAEKLATKGVKWVNDQLRRRKLKSFPLRNKFLPDIKSVFERKGRICAGGPIVLIAVKTEDDYVIILGRRSAKVSDEPLALTPIPRAFHSSEIDLENNEDHKLTTTIYREIWEELFGGRESADGQFDAFYFLEDCPALKNLYDNQGKNHVLVPLGLMWDLYRGNFVASYCLYISDPTWWTNYHRLLKVNWEFDRKNKSAVYVRTARIKDFLQDESWASDSFFCFVEGLRWLCLIDEFKSKLACDLPSLELIPPEKPPDSSPNI
jgi:hypothetical protein